MWASTFLHQDFAVKILKGKDGLVVGWRRGTAYRGGGR
jgi:hypothetical protein